ncbi:MAG: hypothetical protein J0M26_06945 [Planctomycetes bacterium]|nr:hypothetical protein [Planctomycetota bacterium]
MTTLALVPTPMTKPIFALLWFWIITSPLQVARAFQADSPPIRSVLVEFYFDSAQVDHVNALNEIEQHFETIAGVELVARDLKSQNKNQERFQKLANHFKFAPTRIPVLYTCNRIIHPLETEKQWKAILEDTLVLDIYTRIGCSRCVAAKKFMEQITKRYPAFKIRYRELTNDVHARNDLEQLVERYRRTATSTPVFHFIDSLIVGFDQESTSGPRLEAVLKKWTVESELKKKDIKTDSKPVSTPTGQVSEVTQPRPFR